MVKLHGIYHFNDVKTFPETDMSGIWQTVEAYDIGTEDERWKVRRILTSKNESMVGVEKTLPRMVFDLFAYKIDRDAIAGTRLRCPVDVEHI